MTGSGTQADPYIVDNWADFVTAAGTSGAYVEFAADTVIDMDNVAPEGISGITARCSSIDGKGASVKGIFFVSGGFTFVNYIEIKNLNLTEMRTLSGYALNHSENFVYRNCTITGSFAGTGIFSISGSSSLIDCCGFTVQLSGCVFGHGRELPFRSSRIICSGNPAFSGNLTSLRLENSLVQGEKLPIEYFWSSKTSIIDCVIHRSFNASGSTNLLVNSDKIAEGVTVEYGRKVTTEQLKDAEYLASVGFPIVTEELI